MSSDAKLPNATIALCLLWAVCPSALAMAQDEDHVVVNVRPAFTDENFNQWVFQHFGNAQNARKRLDTMLALQAYEVDRICAMSEDQKRKLQLAGRGDIKRFFDRVEESRKKFQLVNNDQNKLPEILQEIQPLHASLQSGLFADDSIFAKTLRVTLTPEQLKQYEQVDGDRRLFRHRARIEMAVATFDNSLPMRDDQRQRLVALLLEEIRFPKRSGPNDQYVVLVQMSRLPDEKLKPLFDGSQWQVLRRLLDRMKGMEQQLKQAGVLGDEADVQLEQAK
jgi:hypothetical protein